MDTTIRPARHNHRNRRTVTTIAAALATFAVAACSTTSEPSAAPTLPVAGGEPIPAGPADAASADGAASAPDPAADDAASGDPNGTEPADPVLDGDDAEDAADLLDDSQPPPVDQPPAPEPPVDDGEDDGGDEAVDLDPVPQGDPHPCDFLIADGSSLVVGPDPLVLDAGGLTGTIRIDNCSDGDIDWTAATKPSVALDDDGANLLPGETADLDFVIDSDQWDPGAIEFKIKVSEPGHNHYIDVQAFRQLSGKDVVADVGFTAGPGAGGCANQCITSALLDPHPFSADLGLDITTNVETTITTWVLDAPPIQLNGVPLLGAKVPTDVSPDGVTEHRAVLAPLDPSTKYHIVVAATDEFDHTAYRIGEFTTITPIENPDGLLGAGDPPGCAAQCITKALVSPGDDHTERHLAVETHTAAQLQAFVSTEAPVWSGGVPSFDDTDVWRASGLEYVTAWETDLEGLEPSTDYHIIVSAIDVNGHEDHRVGEFRSAAAPKFDVVFTVLGIHVDYDGDKNANRGELRFGWRVGDDHVGNRGEAKVSSGDTVTFPRHVSTYVAHDITDWLPTVFVQASERDPDGIIEFCSLGSGVSSQYGSNGDCDLVWNVALSGLYTLDSLTSAPACTEPGHTGARCLTFVSSDAPGGYPEFTARIAVQVNN